MFQLVYWLMYYYLFHNNFLSIHFRWANRVKLIKNKPKINEDPNYSLLREFQQEIARLKAHLEAKDDDQVKKKKSKKTRSGPDGIVTYICSLI